MTDHVEDPFDRVVDREVAAQEWQERVAATMAWHREHQGKGAVQLLALLLVPLPLHLWFVEWDRTGSVLVHLALITVVAMVAAVALIGRAFRPG